MKMKTVKPNENIIEDIDPAGEYEKLISKAGDEHAKS